MNPPFQPPQFSTTVPTTVPGGGWNTYTGPREAGPAAFAQYNGQNQTFYINTVAPWPPPRELGPGPSDPNISASKDASYVGSGYGQVGQGTIGVGYPIIETPGPPPAQARMYVQGSNLIILDNITGQAFAVPLAAAIPQPPIYSPTK